MIHCPHCGEPWSKDDLESIGDIGCPSCRRIFDVEDYIDEDDEIELLPPDRI